MDPKMRRRLLGNGLTRLGLAGALLVLIAGLVGPLVAPHPVDLTRALEHELEVKQPPSWSHPFGTDWHGLDVFSKVLHGARLSLIVAVTAALVSVTLGLVVGLVAGYVGGIADGLAMRTVDVFLAFPELLLAILIATLLEPGLITVFLALVVVSWAGTARLIRSVVLSIKNQEFVIAARAMGASNARIILVHLLPNLLPTLVVIISMRIGVMILAEASLNFLGVGAQASVPSWGVMVFHGKDYLGEAPWCSVFPATAIALTVLSFSLLGDGLRDALDPRMRG